MRSIRMTEFPVLEEIRNEFVELRQQGSDRTTATQKLMQSYRHELTDQEDALLFWIGLADAQYFRKELAEDVAVQASKALDAIENSGWNVSPGDLNRRREHYAKAPMPEKKVGKPKSKFHCPWQVGDTFAFQLTGKEAEDAGISGKYMLLRKVAESECSGGIYPVVTVSLATGNDIPTTKEAYESFPLIKLQAGGRCASPKDKFEYRTVIHIKSVRQLRSLPLIYCGRFVDVPMPPDEIIFNRFGEMMITLAADIEQELCYYWKINNRITSMTQR